MKIVHFVVTTPALKTTAIVSGADRWQLPPSLAPFTSASVVHRAPLPLKDGSVPSNHSYCVAIARDDAVTKNGVTFVDHESLLQRNLLSAEEQLAVRTALSRLARPIAPFDSPTEVGGALEWALREAAARARTEVTSVTRLRTDRHDLVVRLDAGAEVMYLKAGVDRIADEAVLTQLLHALRPPQFPETLALDRQNHRWLYRELQGVPLAATPPEHQAIDAAIRALVSLQKASMGSAAIETHVARRRLTSVDLFFVVDTLLQHAWGAVPHPARRATTSAAWETLRTRMIQSCRHVDELGVPLAFVPSDFWLPNILVTADSIGFIDVGNSYWGCPILPLWRFVRDVRRRLPKTAPSLRASMRHSIGSAFVDAWADVVPTHIMTRAVAYLWLIGRLFGIVIASLDLDLYERALGIELPAGYRATRLAPRVRELLRAFALHTILPQPDEPEFASALDL